MWRRLLIAALLTLTASNARAQLGPWDICSGAPGPVLTDCRPLDGRIDPQGREIWLRTAVPAPRHGAPKALLVYAAASTQAWFNGVYLGANGRPGLTAADEKPGRYEAVMPVPDHLWRPAGNQLVLRMSAFHVGMRFAAPVGAVAIGRYPQPSRLPLLAVTFVAAGALAAAAFGFGAIFALRRTPSSGILAAMAAVGATQALVENLRHLWRYEYPIHAWRVGAIWVLAVAFSILLVAWAATRFWPRRAALLLAVAAAAVPASWAASGFDVKSGLALTIGATLAAGIVVVGVRAKTPGARPALAWLAIFIAAAFGAPFWLLDVSFFVLAAGLALPLLVAEVLRLGRQDIAREAALTRAASFPERLSVATARGVELVPLRNVTAILGADDYAEIRCRGGRSVLHAARLDHLEASLPETFVRIHRSAIANLAHADRLIRDGQRWRLEMREGEALPVSRSRLAGLRARLETPCALPLTG